MSTSSAMEVDKDAGRPVDQDSEMQSLDTAQDSKKRTSHSDDNTTTDCDESSAVKKIKLENSVENEDSEKQTDDDLVKMERIVNQRFDQVIESVLEQIMEEFFLQHGGVSFDFYLWKKKFPLQAIVDAILGSYKSTNLGSLALTPMKLLESNLLADQSNPLYPPAITQRIFAESFAKTTLPSKSESKLSDSKNTTLPPTNVPSNSKSSINENNPPSASASSTHIRKTSANSGLLEEATPSIDLYEKAKQEAAVMQRIAELRKAGMWSIKRLPKVVDMSRPKIHWDFLLEEMQWLAADFISERKWKKNAAKKCGKMVMKHLTMKQNEVIRLEKEEKDKVKKIAVNISKMVKNFWNEISKIIETKEEFLIKEKVKKMQDMHLKMIVDKADLLTETISHELTFPVASSSAPSVDGSCTEDESLLKDQDFDPDKEADTTDDEEHITKDEDQAEDNELELLHKEENMDFDDLASMLPPGYLESLAYGKDVKVEGGDESSEMEETNSQTTEIKEESTEEADMEEDITEKVDSDNEDADIKNMIFDKKTNEKTATDLVAAEAESIQPKGYTFSLVEVRTKIPFLIKYSLREYQHIGLDWMVALYEKNLNGILADEMGLGKTIQTISLLAHLACDRQIWGPHLIVVPTSVMLNWEMELKKWCPALKVLTYYGTPKERKLKRVGWTKQNSFHVCITSYKLVVQDHSSFRRKKWVYMILDEAQHIKNFKSQRWQMLLNFNSERRLLLTGTPLQNNLMDLWSLMHFLMPNVFESHKEFKDWFVNPVTGMAEGNHEKNEELIRRLHRILRPFLLRRLKSDVEKQMPKKYEHIIKCQLSKRQRTLYEEFMGLSRTKETLSNGNFLSVINVLMQLRKVCNHPNLFDPRPAVSPYIQDALVVEMPELFMSVTDYDPLNDLLLENFHLLFSHLSSTLTTDSMFKTNYYQYNLVHMKKTSDRKPQVYAKLNDFKDFYRRLCQLNIVKSQEDSKYFLKLAPTVSVKNEKEETDEILESYHKEVIPSKENLYGFGEFSEGRNHQHAVGISSEKLHRLAKFNKIRCTRRANIVKDLVDCMDFSKSFIQNESSFSNARGSTLCLRTQCQDFFDDHTNILAQLVKNPVDIELCSREVVGRFQCIVPNVIAPTLKVRVSHIKPYKMIERRNYETTLSQKMPLERFDLLHSSRLNQRVLLPETRLIQYDCGKLHVLDELLCRLKTEKHRVLIFTQMSKMLDIFEQFLNYHGHTYLRLDGSTKIDQRQILMERFNADPKIFCFILSTRSGGVGINLTGADTVVFYDSDWNPTMDAQAQDRCHRIGQTRDVHIYRLISEKTIEENILKKAQQKKFMADIAIEDGKFNSAFFKQGAIKDLFDSNYVEDDEEAEDMNDEPTVNDNLVRSAFEQALGTVEDQSDVIAAKNLKCETAGEFAEFDETIPLEEERDERNVEVEQLNEFISCLLPIEQYAIDAMERTKEFLELKQAEEEMEETKKNYQKSIAEWQVSNEENRRKMLEEMNDNMLTCSREDASNSKVYKNDDGTFETLPLWHPPTPPQNENDVYFDYASNYIYEATIMPESELPPVYVPKDNKRIRLESSSSASRKPVPGAGLPAAAGAVTQKPSKRQDDLFIIPKSPFDRSSSIIVRLRREMLMMKMKCWPGSPNLISCFHRTLSHLGPSALPPSNLSSAQMLAKNQTFQSNVYPRWLIHEEFAMINVLIYLQDLSFNLSPVCPGHIPNWNFVADQVNTFNCFKKADRFCRYHFESVLATRENENDAESVSALHNMMTKNVPLLPPGPSTSTKKISKKKKLELAAQQLQQQQQTQQQPPQQPPLPNQPPNPLVKNLPPGQKGPPNPALVAQNVATQNSLQPLLKMTTALHRSVQDNNVEFTCEMNRRFEVIKQIVIQKSHTSKLRFRKGPANSFDHVSLLKQDYMIDYNNSVSVEKVAAVRTARIQRDREEKQRKEEREREAREISQIKAFMQGDVAKPPDYALPIQSNSQSSFQPVQQSPRQQQHSQVANSSMVAGTHQIIVGSPMNKQPITTPQGQIVPPEQIQVSQIPQNNPSFVASPPTFQQVYAAKIGATNVKIEPQASAKILGQGPQGQTVQSLTISQAASMGLINTSSVSSNQGTVPVNIIQQSVQPQQGQVVQQQFISAPQHQGTVQGTVQTQQGQQSIPINVMLNQKFLTSIGSQGGGTQTVVQSSQAQMGNQSGTTQVRMATPQQLQVTRQPIFIRQNNVRSQAPNSSAGQTISNVQVMPAGGQNQSLNVRAQIPMQLVNNSNLQPASTVSGTQRLQFTNISSIANGSSISMGANGARLTTNILAGGKMLTSSTMSGSLIKNNSPLIVNNSGVVARTVSTVSTSSPIVASQSGQFTNVQSAGNHKPIQFTSVKRLSTFSGANIQQVFVQQKSSDGSSTQVGTVKQNNAYIFPQQSQGNTSMAQSVQNSGNVIQVQQSNKPGTPIMIPASSNQANQQSGTSQFVQLTAGQKVVGGQVTNSPNLGNSGDANQQSSTPAATIKILNNSGATSGSGLSTKSHIIISGPAAASLFNSQSGAANSALTSSLLQQVANASGGASGQTLTFAIRTSSSTGQPQLSTITLKPPSSGTSTPTSSALVAALSQSSDSPQSSSGGGQLLRTLTSTNTQNNQKSVPIVLMQPSQQNQSGTIISGSTQQQQPPQTRTINIVPGQKITGTQIGTQQTKTLTGVLQAPRPASVGPMTSSGGEQLQLNIQTVNKSSTPPVSASASSPLIEALMSPVGKRAVGGSPSSSPFDPSK